jgi:putative FmdB family regulatory protein
MPIYTYKCSSCGYVFEELVSYEKRDEGVGCSLCKGAAVRSAAETFGISTTLNPQTDTIYSNKEIDQVVGRESEKKWAGYNEQWNRVYKERQQKRWKGAEPKMLDLPKDPDGKISPIMHLGDNKQKGIRKEFSTALQEHRAERQSRGEAQCDAPGNIA